MEIDQIRSNFQLMLQIRRPLASNERLNREMDVSWVEAVKKLLTADETGNYPWQRYRLGDGTVVEFKTLEEYISSENGLRTSPARMLKLLEADPIEGASEAAEKLRGALKHQGSRTDLKPDFVDNVNEVPVRATGNSRARVIREIRQLAESDDHRSATAAELLDRIHARDISANAAAIQLGLRSKALNFDLYKLTPEVRGEIENLKVQEDWTTAEVLEEALRAYFRILTAEENVDPEPSELPGDTDDSKPLAVTASPKPDTGGMHNRAKPPEGFMRGIEVADLCGVNRNSIGQIVTRAHSAKQDAELTSKDGKRLFVRRVGQKFWEEIL